MTRRVRIRELFLCNDHLRAMLPISGRVIIHLESELGCQRPHPDIERVLEEAAHELNERRVPA